jgi:hypothetical protein
VELRSFEVSEQGHKLLKALVAQHHTVRQVQSSSGVAPTDPVAGFPFVLAFVTTNHIATLSRQIS